VIQSPDWKTVFALPQRHRPHSGQGSMDEALQNRKPALTLSYHNPLLPGVRGGVQRYPNSTMATITAATMAISTKTGTKLMFPSLDV